jgi:hypothetical protein
MPFNRTDAPTAPGCEGPWLISRHPSGERVVADVPTELATDLRVTCARSRRNMSDTAKEALTMWLSAQSTKLTRCQKADLRSLPQRGDGRSARRAS